MRLLLAWTTLLVACAAAAAQTSAALAPSDDPNGSDFVARLLRLGPAKPFGRPITINSVSRGKSVRADLEALVDRPFHDVQAALADPWKWCAVLILHINNTGCRAEFPDAAGPRIALKVSRNHDEPVEQAFDLDFAYQPVTASALQVSVRLSAAKGPMGTSNHVLVFDAIPAGDSRTAVRLSYSYGQSMLTDWAVHLYLATFGRGKVGFSSSEADDDGQVRYVGGIRGLLERNLVLYLIAIDAAARTPTVPDNQAFRQRLRDYFAATERYPRQLREVDLETYLSLKQPLTAVAISTAGLR